MTAADRPSVTDDARAEANPVSSTGHRWPCVGYYVTSTEKDRTERCTCAWVEKWAAGRAETTTVTSPKVASKDAETTTDLHPVVTEHQIIGTQTGKQGAGQVVPEDSVLCIKCGWMRCSDYTWHLSDALAAAGRAETTTEDEACGDYPAPCNCDDPETHDGATSAETTTATTEDALDAATEAVEAEFVSINAGSDHGARDVAEAAVYAFLGARGLLATARTRPTRDDVSVIAQKVAAEHRQTSHRDRRLACSCTWVADHYRDSDLGPFAQWARHIATQAARTARGGDPS